MSDVLEENEGIALASAEGETTISELDPNPSVEDTDLLATEKSDGSNAKTTVEQLKEVTDSQIETALSGYYNKNSVDELINGALVNYQPRGDYVTRKYSSYIYLQTNGTEVINFNNNAINKKCSYMVTVTGDYSVGKYAGILFVGNNETSIVQLLATNMTVTTTTSALTIKNTGNAQNFSIQITEM